MVAMAVREQDVGDAADCRRLVGHESRIAGEDGSISTALPAKSSRKAEWPYQVICITVSSISVLRDLSPSIRHFYHVAGSAVSQEKGLGKHLGSTTHQTGVAAHDALACSIPRGVDAACSFVVSPNLPDDQPALVSAGRGTALRGLPTGQKLQAATK